VRQPRIGIVTPEMVRLDLELARPGNRIVAFSLDVVLLVLLSGLSAFGASMLIALAQGSRAMGYGLLLLVLFLIRTFYFIAFEMSWRGQTPGKRAMNLRVVANDGGALLPSMVLARNLTREAEVFLPVIIMLAPGVLVPNAGGPVRLAAVVWIAIIAFLPLLNRRGARLGDLVAGTSVVVQPRAVLLDDLIGSAAASARQDEPRPAEDAGDEPGPSFTKQQLDVYGIYELQVLEDVLRKHDSQPNAELLDVVCEKIMRKIGWKASGSGAPMSPEEFLRAFYAAQRGRLEHQMLLGRRREHKRG
jgi:uncharacterized RDD family membrane protein YckC